MKIVKTRIKTKNSLLQNTAIPFQAIYPKDSRSVHQGDICSSMFIAVLL